MNDYTCFCTQCSQTALFTLGVQALTPREFIERARRFKLDEKQQRIYEGMKLMAWKESSKGENE